VKAARLVQPREWEIIEVKQKAPGPDQMLVRLEQVAICGSDMPDYLGIPPHYPLEPGGSGHEGIGTVMACPAGTYEEGERVLLWGFDRDNGLFQEEVLTKNEGLLRMPRDEQTEKVLMSQLLGTVIRCFRKLGNIINQNVVVLGQGPAGQLFNATARNLGAKRVIGADLEDFRLEVGARMGATHGINASQTDLAEEVRRITEGAMADVVIEAVGGEDTYGLCLDLTHRHSYVICFGVPDKENHEGAIRLPLMEMQRKELRLVTSVNYGDNPYEDYAVALDWIMQGRIDVGPMVTHVLPFEQIQRGFELAVDRPVADRPVKVVLQF
jgi:threonine dehydrogenase-like Zn-dependent dehydrogenase